jgi:hypothetical protein
MRAAHRGQHRSGRYQWVHPACGGRGPAAAGCSTEAEAAPLSSAGPPRSSGCPVGRSVQNPDCGARERRGRPGVSPSTARPPRCRATSGGASAPWVDEVIGAGWPGPRGWAAVTERWDASFWPRLWLGEHRSSATSLPELVGRMSNFGDRGNSRAPVFARPTIPRPAPTTQRRILHSCGQSSGNQLTHQDQARRDRLPRRSRGRTVGGTNPTGGGVMQRAERLREAPDPGLAARTVNLTVVPAASNSPPSSPYASGRTRQTAGKDRGEAGCSPPSPSALY